MKEIPVYAGYKRQRYQVEVTVVDDEDYEFLMQWKWYLKIKCNTKYALRTEKRNRKTITYQMARVIAEERMGLIITDLLVDHEDGNGLNNQRYNLQVVTHSENAQKQHVQLGSTTGVKGVTYHESDQKYYARITVDGITHQLGIFSTIDEATIARREAELKYFTVNNPHGIGKG